MAAPWGSLTGALDAARPRSARAWRSTCSGPAWAFRRRDWWRRPPFLPLPDRNYLRWRMYTAYADEAAVPPVEDVVRFARWRRETMGLE